MGVYGFSRAARSVITGLFGAAAGLSAMALVGPSIAG
jgi:hypothetical protein